MDRARIRLNFLTSPIVSDPDYDASGSLMEHAFDSRVSEATSNISVRIQDGRFICFSNLCRVDKSRIRLSITYIAFNEERTITISYGKAGVN